MKKLFLVFAIFTLLVLIGTTPSGAQCPEDSIDLGECDTLNVICLDCKVDTTDPGPYLVRFPLLVTHDQAQAEDSISGFAIPLAYTHTNPSAYCSLSYYWNQTVMLYLAPTFPRSIFRHMLDGEDTLYVNRMAQLEGDFSNRGWDFVVLDLDGTSHFWLSLVPTGSQDQRWWESDRVLLATMTMMVQDTMHVCVDSTFWPPATSLSFGRYDDRLYTPRDNLPHCFWVGEPRIQVIAPNGGESWGVGTDQKIAWLSENFDQTKANVKIEYSTNSGGSWVTVQSSIPDTGSFLWPVPATPSEHCRIRVSDAVDATPYDISDADFSIGYPDFVIEAEPDTQEVQAGISVDFDVILTSLFGFASSCTLTVSGLPAHTSGSLVPNPLIPTDTSRLSISTTRDAPPGTYPVMVTATELAKGRIQHSTQVVLVITPPPDFTIEASPDTLPIPQDDQDSYEVVLTSLHGFDSACTLTVSVLPPEVTGTFYPPTLVPTGTSILNISVSDAADTGFYDLTITATEMAGGRQVQHSTQVVLRVTPPSDFTIQASPDTLLVPQAEEDGYEVVLTSLWGFGAPCTLVVAGLPPEVSGDFDPPIVVPTGSSDLNIAAPDSADTGFYDLTITATEMTGGKQIQHGTQAVLRVTPPRDFTIQVQPDSQDVQASFSVDFDVILTSLWGFASPCSLAVSGLPLGASAGFDPNPSIPSDTSIMSISTTRATLPGTYLLTVTATELTRSGVQHSAQVILVVTPPPDFTIEAEPDTQEVQATFSVDFDVILTSLYDFASPCTLSTTGLPLGASAEFHPNPAIPSDTSVLSIHTARATPPGTYEITLTAVELTKAQVQHSTQVVLIVSPPPDFTIEAEPDTQLVQASFSTSFDILLTSVFGFASACTLTTSGLPSGVSAGFDPNPIVPTDSSLMSINTTRDAPEGTYILTVTAAALAETSLQHSTQVVLIITPPPDFTVDVEPDSQEVQAGDSVHFDVNLTSLYGFASPCTLTTGGLPVQTSGSFNPSVVIPTGVSDLQVNTGVTTPPGAYTVTVTASKMDKGLIHSDQFRLNVTPPPDFSIQAQPETLQVLSGETGSYNVMLTSLYGFDSPCTLSVSGLPQDATGEFDPVILIPTDSSQLTVTVAETTPTGMHQLTITATQMGTGKNLEHSVQVLLVTGCVVLRVPLDYSTIQAGIEAARDCDTILVSPGIYTGTGNKNIDFLGKAIVVRSEAGPGATIIDCENQGRGFCFYNSEGPESRLVGFTIAGGLVGDGGGGILCEGSSPTIVNCRIEYNSTYISGGGILCRGSSPIIADCTILGNETLVHGTGGGMACENNSLPTIANCTIVDNTATTGGGIFLEANSQAFVLNDLIVWNSGCGVYGEPNSGCSILCSDVYGNSDFNYGGSIGDQTGINGNICECPLFCDLSDDEFYISQTSPCAPENNQCGVLMGAWETGCSYRCADATADGITDLADVVYLLNFLFRYGPAPLPMQAGDVNCDVSISVADVVYLLNYLYKGGPAPCP
jgi:hypothetical protein